MLLPASSEALALSETEVAPLRFSIFAVQPSPSDTNSTFSHVVPSSYESSRDAPLILPFSGAPVT
jgi:hypothetical protein